MREQHVPEVVENVYYWWSCLVEWLVGRTEQPSDLIRSTDIGKERCAGPSRSDRTGSGIAGSEGAGQLIEHLCNCARRIEPGHLVRCRDVTGRLRIIEVVEHLLGNSLDDQVRRKLKPEWQIRIIAPELDLPLRIASNPDREKSDIRVYLPCTPQESMCILACIGRRTGSKYRRLCKLD